MEQCKDLAVLASAARAVWVWPTYFRLGVSLIQGRAAAAVVDGTLGTNGSDLTEVRV
jgi:hypothetical protein